MSDPSVLDCWHDDAHQLWMYGRHQAAIDLLLARINAASSQVPKRLGLQLVYYVYLLGDCSGAENFLLRLLDIYPGDTEILENLAVVISRQAGRTGEALHRYRQLCEIYPDKANIWDGLAHALSSSAQFEEARQAGERSLMLKTANAPILPNWEPPDSVTPEIFLQRPDPGGRSDCISFSIWGGNPRYLRGVLRNVLLIPDLYPGWHARLYHDETVPGEFISLLRSLGAQLKLMPPGQTLRQKLCWRFQVANDPGVGRFLVRDCDSVVNQREVRAVEAWMASGRWFHIMRDWWTHTDPILAGLWGGISGVLPNMQTLLAQYSPPARDTASVDQWFLRDVLWGSIRHHALIHDRCFRSEGSQPWPDPDPSGNLHVGQDEFSVRRDQQAIWLSAWIRRHACLQLPDHLPTTPKAASQEEPELQIISRSFPCSLSSARYAMPLGVSGRVINLDTARERWQRMQLQIDALGWSQSHRREPALTASSEEAKTFGLRNGGELGLWRTTMTLLEQWLASHPSVGEVLHIVEDDTILNPSLPVLVEAMRDQAATIDILFTEAFLTSELYRRLRCLEKYRQRNSNSVLLLNGGLYLAGSTSYLVSRDAAQRLLEALDERYASGRLVPIDMAFRQWIREKRLSASISLPFFSTVSSGLMSSLQGDRSASVQMSQNADLCLRQLFYRQTWEPELCGEILKELSGLLADGLTSEQIEMMVLEVLATGRSEGLLSRY